MARRRYRRKGGVSSVVRDVADVGSRSSWKGGLVLGVVAFVIFYFMLPAWAISLLQERQHSQFYPLLQAIFERRLHWLQWIGIACGLVGMFFGMRNYYFAIRAGREERGLVAFLARILGRSLD